MNVLKTVGIAGALLAAPMVALAQGKQDFTLTNGTGYDINEVYVAPSKSKSWEEDVLGWDVLSNGDAVEITFPKKVSVCMYDLKVVYSDGTEAEWAGFNLCEVSEITIRYNRKTDETWADYN